MADACATDAGVDIFSMYAMDGTLIYQEDLKRNKRIYHAYLAGDPVAQVEVDIASGASTSKYLHTDALGSPVAVTNATSGILERTQYEPYGLVINRALRDGPGYTGHVEDASSGLNYMQQRYYDPIVERFLSVDPIGPNGNIGTNFNRYKYGANNPYTFIDPDGRSDLNVFTSTDPLYAAGEAFFIPGIFTLTGHADPTRIIGPTGDMTPDQTIALARGAGLQKGHTLFVGACNIGAGGGGYAQSLADKNMSLVIAATGFAMFPTTRPKSGGNPYVPGNPVTLTVNSQRDGKGAAGTFAVFAPGGSSPIADGIRSVTFDPTTGKATLRLAPSAESRFGERVTVCVDKEKCGK